MNKAIESLESTTFAGHRFTRKKLAEIQQTVNTFSNLSHRELGHTLCEHLGWVTPTGETHQIQTCLNALQEMEAAGLFRLPKKKQQATSIQKKITGTQRTDSQPDITGTLEQFAPLCLQKVTRKDDIELWNEYVDRYHYLGYRKPMGTHLRYFIVSQANQKQILGCLVFSFATCSLACRDQWIGWNKTHRKHHLKRVLNNNRFLLFPWVKVKNLASKALSLATARVADDWEQRYGFRPLLLETFVDPENYTGSCYKAANWQCIGKTKGKKASSKTEAVSAKAVYVYPLEPDFRTALMDDKKQTCKKKTAKIPPSTLESNDPLVALWQHVIHIVFDVAEAFDRQWQKRQRVINTLLLVLFIFRLVFSKNKQSYGTTSSQLWKQCRDMNIPLPQQTPVAPSAFSNARKKLDETIFKTINSRIITTYGNTLDEQRWKGHRLFAVDGTKVNLPRQLLDKPYKTPSKNAYYPQGLVSCLYQLTSKIPYDFDLVPHQNERTLALSHLKQLHEQDVVVYDRGYFSYAMLYYHHQAGVDAVFRLQQNSFKAIDAFFESDSSETRVTLEVDKKRQKQMLEKYPSITFIPLKLRLVKYDYGDTTYVLGTTLQDTVHYTTDELSDLYHSRWGIEELYKVSKVLIDVEDFHGQSERGVKQELFAHFVLITLNRIFTHHTEKELNKKEDMTENPGPILKVNVKNALTVMAQHLESLFLQQLRLVTETINHMIDAMAFCKQKERPGRHYERSSKKPVKKWKPSKSKPSMGSA